MSGDKGEGLCILLLVLLLTLIFLPTLSWVLTVWQQSPLDRQAPLFFILAVAMWGAHKDYGDMLELPKYVVLSLYVVAMLLHILSLIIDVWMMSVFAIMLVLLPLALLYLGHWLSVLLLLLLLGLSLPTISFILGGLLQQVVPGGYALGECVKWPLAFFAVATLYDREGWRTYILLIILAPALAAFSLAAVGSMGREQFGWLGSSPFASGITAGLAIAVWYAGVLWRRRQRT